nr:hypothetical protein CJLB15_00022 [Campylobacter phage CJLB-15]
MYLSRVAKSFGIWGSNCFRTVDCQLFYHNVFNLYNIKSLGKTSNLTSVVAIPKL